MRGLRFDPDAERDFDALFAWIADRGGERVASRHVQRLEAYCYRLIQFRNEVLSATISQPVCVSLASSGASR